MNEKSLILGGTPRMSHMVGIKIWEKFKNDHDFSHNSGNNQTKF
jgi:hypothetical protein